MSNVCVHVSVCGAEQRLVPPSYKIYILNVPEMLHYRSEPVLPSCRQHEAVSADVLLCRLMADYDIKCL